MSAVSSASTGVTDLLQAFSGGSSPLPSALSTSAVQKALQKAAPVDLVHLSEQALQLQQVAGLFGAEPSQSASQDPLTLLLQTLGQQSSGVGNTINLLG